MPTLEVTACACSVVDFLGEQNQRVGSDADLFMEIQRVYVTGETLLEYLLMLRNAIDDLPIPFV
jgi:hypothetical protein